METPGKITLWQIEIFVAAAEEPSITAAAQRLNASPSAVSQQLSNLETALGATLLNRKERPMPLTPAGELFLRRAQIILNEAAQASAELAVNDLAARVRLRLGVVEDFDADVTPALLTKLADRMPRAEFLLETGASHRLLDQLETRALDVVIAAETEHVSSQVEMHPLLTDPYVLIAPKKMFHKDGDLLSQLSQHPFIQYTSRHVMGRQISGHLARVGVSGSTRFELDSYHAIAAMVARSEGWSILSALGVMRASRFLSDLDLFELPFDAFGRRISLISQRDFSDEMPSEIAALARPLLQSEIVEHSIRHMPWLRDQMRVLS